MNWSNRNPRHRNPGLKQGFVKFGTIAHRILVALHRRGKASIFTWFVLEMPDLDDKAIAMTLTYLGRYGYIFNTGKVNGHDSPTGVAQTRWALREVTRPRYRRISQAKRQAKCRNAKREAQAARVPSVFQFRGEIHVTSEV